MISGVRFTRTGFLWILLLTIAVLLGGCNLLVSSSSEPLPGDLPPDEPENVSTLKVEDGVLKIVTWPKTFALMALTLDLKGEPEELVVETDMRTISGASRAGNDWAPGIFLYWDANKWLGIRNNTNSYYFSGFNGKSYTKEFNEWLIEPIREVWTGLRLVMTDETIKVYVSDEKGDWHYLREFDRPGEGLPLLLVGKGMGGTQLHPGPYLANANAGSSGFGDWPSRAEYRSVLVKADDEIVFSEDFSDEDLEANGWIPLVFEDPKFQDYLEHLNSIY